MFIIVLLNYFLGECWVQLLEKIDEKYLCGAEEMVARLLFQEVKDLPRGIYALPLGATEPFSYKNLPPSSVLKGLTHHLRKVFKNGLFHQR